MQNCYVRVAHSGECQDIVNRFLQKLVLTPEIVIFIAKKMVTSPGANNGIVMEF
jgi:hypothetical protein